MPLGLTAGSTALAPGLFTYFLGTGGTGPYTYSVLPGGVGGTINPTTGLYTAPQVQGSDTIQVTDSLAATATLDVMVGDALELFCDIIQREMGLSPGRVFLWNQKYNTPKDAGLYIAVGVISCKPFGNSTKLLSSGDAEQSVNMWASLSIDIFSRGPEARERKEEIILALNSIYAQQQQELNSFYVGKLSTGFVNLSEVEGGAILYRFNISASIQYAVKKVKSVPFYDDFGVVDVAQVEP